MRTRSGQTGVRVFAHEVAANTLFRAGMVTPEDIAYAMVEGSLPQYFEDNVRNLDFEDESFYTQELVSRDLFCRIKWDTKMLDVLDDGP